MSDEPRLSRRDLFRGKLFGRVAAAASSAVDRTAATLNDAVELASKPPAAPGRIPTHGPESRRVALPVLRPPGAVNETALLAGCTRCSECVAACPVGAILHAPPRFREAAGTPMIDPYQNACVLCPDTPCISACAPGVLRIDQPLKMGVAWIQTMACLAHTGSFCSVCSERCPVPGAIEVNGGKPRIREDTCLGCGVCASVCPAPANAVVVMPLAVRTGASKLEQRARPAAPETCPETLD